jgi:hypothetical protein
MSKASAQRPVRSSVDGFLACIFALACDGDLRNDVCAQVGDRFYLGAMTALLMRAKRPAPETDGELVYTVHRDASGQYRVLRHASSDDTPALLPLDQTHPALTPPHRQRARE